MEGTYTGKAYEAINQNIKNFINSINQKSESFRTFLVNYAITDFNNKIENTINKDEFRNVFIDNFKHKFPEISIDKIMKELKQNKLYELTNDQIIQIFE